MSSEAITRSQTTNSVNHRAIFVPKLTDQCHTLTLIKTLKRKLATCEDSCLLDFNNKKKKKKKKKKKNPPSLRETIHSPLPHPQTNRGPR